VLGKAVPPKPSRAKKQTSVPSSSAKSDAGLGSSDKKRKSASEPTWKEAQKVKRELMYAERAYTTSELSVTQFNEDNLALSVSDTAGNLKKLTARLHPSLRELYTGENMSEMPGPDDAEKRKKYLERLQLGETQTSGIHSLLLCANATFEKDQSSRLLIGNGVMGSAKIYESSLNSDCFIIKIVLNLPVP